MVQARWILCAANYHTSEWCPAAEHLKPGRFRYGRISYGAALRQKGRVALVPRPGPRCAPSGNCLVKGYSAGVSVVSKTSVSVLAVSVSDSVATSSGETRM